MPQVYIYCPATKEPVYTGLNFDWQGLEAAKIGTMDIECPVCGEHHSWTTRDAFLRADGGGD